MNNTPRLATFRARQEGGLTIIMALVLVAVMGAATFSLSRNAIRELSMAGTVIQGEKAGASADAGLDWVIIWGQGGVSQAAFNGATPGTAQKNLLDGIKSILSSSTGYSPLILNGSGQTAMSLNQTNTTQDFDIEVRFLGNLPPSRTGGGSSDNSGASGGTKVSSSSGDYFWRVLSTGRATPKDGQTYQAQREMTATLPVF